MLDEHFGTIGLLKKDKRTGRPKIWIYPDKVTNEPERDATVTYAALAAVEWFNSKEFHGATIRVFMAESKGKDDTANHGSNQALSSDVNDLEEGLRDANGGGGRGRGRGEAGGNPWQQDGDWLCNVHECKVCHVIIGVCNRCGTACPAGASGGVEGRGRGDNDSVEPAGAAAATGRGLFGPNDWSCPMYVNINWAKR